MEKGKNREHERVRKSGGMEWGESSEPVVDGLCPTHCDYPRPHASRLHSYRCQWQQGTVEVLRVIGTHKVRQPLLGNMHTVIYCRSTSCYVAIKPLWRQVFVNYVYTSLLIVPVPSEPMKTSQNNVVSCQTHCLPVYLS